MKKKDYRHAKRALQIQLVILQRHLIAHDKRLAIVIEGRDAAGKDGTIKRLVQHLSPRETRIVALGKPSDRDRASWYFQRYAPYMPANGEIVIFNRSWYNRAGVEQVMGFCSAEEHEAFYRDVLPFERLVASSGTTLLKYYLDITSHVQAKRLMKRRSSPLKSWKTSPVDAAAIDNWANYTKARDRMLGETSPDDLPWRVVAADDKRSARLAVMADILRSVPCDQLDPPERGGFGESLLRGHEALAAPDFLAR